MLKYVKNVNILQYFCIVFVKFWSGRTTERSVKDRTGPDRTVRPNLRPNVRPNQPVRSTTR